MNDGSVFFYLQLEFECMFFKRMRWEMGSVMPADIRYNMSELESQWFNTYCKVFAEYMSKLGDHGGLGMF